MLGYGLGGLTAVAVAAFVVVAMLGGSGGAGAVEPSTPGQVQTSGSPRSSMLAIGDSLPSFSTPGFHMEAGADGGFVVKRERIDLSAYQGKPMVLSIWAPWCPHCQVELPRLSSVMQDYPNVNLITVVTAIGQEPGPTANGYLADRGLTFPVALDDTDGTLARAMGVQAFPTVYFVNSDGTVAQAATGEIAEPDLRSVIQSLS